MTTKKLFRREWEPYFSSFDDEELMTIVLWVEQVREMGMWPNLVEWQMMKKIEEQRIIDEAESLPEDETLH